MYRLAEDMTLKDISLALSDPCIPNGDEQLDREKYIVVLSKMDIVKELIEEIVTIGSLYDRKEYSIVNIANVKELNELDNDLPIINKALVNYMTNNIPFETTINYCDDLKQFQKVVKVTNKYVCGWHNGQKQNEKTFRVFASTNANDTFIGKVKIKNGKEAIEKFANTPDNCFIFNGDVNKEKVPNNLNRQYYIDMAKKRLEQFGM